MFNEQPGVCGPCGGNCCKNGPGRYHPSDFADLDADLPALIDCGGACLDWWEGDFDGTPGPVYYVRPREKGYEHRALHAGWERTCSNLTATGCALPWDSRPYGCRALVPKTATSVCDYPQKWPEVHGKAAQRRRAKGW